jgi:hypothetical protein
VELRFSPEEEDWENVIRSSPKQGRVWNTFQFVLTFVPLFFLGAGLVDAGFSVAGWFCMGFAIAIAFAAYEVPRARRRRQFRTSPFAAGERVLTINANGIAAIFPNATAQYGWQAFTRCRETELSFLLLTAPYSIGLWIPKREMSPQQIEELRHILKARLPAR